MAFIIQQRVRQRALRDRLGNVKQEKLRNIPCILQRSLSNASNAVGGFLYSKEWRLVRSQGQTIGSQKIDIDLLHPLQDWYTVSNIYLSYFSSSSMSVYECISTCESLCATWNLSNQLVSESKRVYDNNKASTEELRVTVKCVCLCLCVFLCAHVMAITL